MCDEPTDTNVPAIKTERLLLRAWHDEDLAPFARLNADPPVVEHLPAPLTRKESDAFVVRIREHFRAHGFGLWAVEIRDTRRFAGFVGLTVPAFDAHFTPCVEAGWRLAHDAWGRGYATEAARAALVFAFERADIDEVVSFTVPANTRSIAVMERVGMTRDPDGDFAHPRVETGHPLSQHVLYRIARGAPHD